MKRFVRRVGGFTFVEVIVAVAVFGFAILAMATSASFMSKRMEIARRDVRLAFAAQQKMEELLAAGYDALATGTDTVAGFPMAWVVSGSKPKTVVLVASYEAFGKTRSDTLVAQVAKP